MIQRFVISWCGRRKIDIDVCQRVASGWHLTSTKRSTQHVKPFTHHAIHTRLYHTTLLCTNKLREAEDVKKDMSALHIKKRGSRRKDVIRDDKISKNDAWNVKALATAEEYNLEGLADGLLNQQLYIASKISMSTSCLYPLDFDKLGNDAVKMAISEPQRFVLKPQREGGCNNKYGTDIRDYLQSVKSNQTRVAWILMDRLYPPVHRNYIVKPGNSTKQETKELISELGIFGVVLGNDRNILINKQGGHMLRTKLATDNEGGVATGLGACDTLPDVIHAVAKYEVGYEPREIFFFREGSLVMWNISDLECGNLLQFLRQYEHNRYTEELIHTESELMTYTHADIGKKSHLRDGDIILAREYDNLDKCTFSNAMAQSVKLGIWEMSLNRYIDSIEFVTEDLKAGRKLRMTQSEVLRKQGELFNLRHRINLSSDLLDTPDFYWEHDDLENLYQQIYSYLSIKKRTKVMNEKLNHCVELVSILSSHLSDRHHVRLEWMIIILIMVEVAFETLHYIDRYLVK